MHVIQVEIKSGVKIKAYFSILYVFPVSLYSSSCSVPYVHMFTVRRNAKRTECYGKEDIYPADLLGAGVEVDGVVVSLDQVVPPRLNVRNLHGITDGLNMAGGRPRLGTEQTRHTRLQQVAH